MIYYYNSDYTEGRLLQSHLYIIPIFGRTDLVTIEGSDCIYMGPFISVKSIMMHT